MNMISGLKNQNISLSMVDISNVSTKVERHGYKSYKNLLTDWESTYINNIKIPKRRHDFLSGRLAGKRAIKEHLARNEVFADMDLRFNDIEISGLGTVVRQPGYVKVAIAYGNIRVHIVEIGRVHLEWGDNCRTVAVQPGCIHVKITRVIRDIVNHPDPASVKSCRCMNLAIVAVRVYLKNNPFQKLGITHRRLSIIVVVIVILNRIVIVC